MPSDLEYKLQPLREKIQVPETEESWDKIAKAIIGLTNVMNDEGTEYPTELTQLLRSLYRPLTCAAISERTRLSSAALELFKASAETLGKSFLTIIPLYLPTLLTLCTRPNKVVITRAKACIISVVESTQSPSILSFLADAIKDKSVTLRLAASECALACLNTFNPPDLEREKRAKEIESIIKSTAVDANADVRKLGRKIFDAYQILLPNRVDNFISPMTPTIKKYLDIRAKPPSAPPSRPASSMSTHSVNSLHAITRPKSTVPHSSSSNQLTKSSSSRHGDTHTRTNSITQSESAPNVAARLISSTSSQSSTRSTTGPSRPRVPSVQRGPSRAEIMLPPQSLPLRPPVSPASSTASDYFADLGSSTKTPGPFRPVTGPSRVPQNEVQDPSAQARPRVVGGARRVLLPDPSVAPKDAPEASTSKPPVRPGPSRATTAPATTQASRPPVSSSTTTAATAKVAPKLPVRSRTESIVKPKVLSSSTSTNTAKTSTTTTSRPTKPDAGVPIRSRTISRLTEPTQAQLARAKATTRPPVAAKKEIAKPFVPSRTAAKSTSAVKGVPVEKDRKKKPGSAIVTVKKGREKTPAPEIVTEAEKVVEVAKMVPLPPSPQGEALAFPSVSPEPPVVEEHEQVIDAGQVDAASEDESAPEIGTETEIETETETEGEKDMTIQSETEEPESELEEDATPTQPISPPQEPEENVDEPNEDDEELDEDTLREAMDTPQDLPQFFLQPESNPSTPQARPSKSHSQLVPETPISALLASIQMGFDLSPAPSYDADQTMTFGGLLPRDRAQCEPLFLGDRRRR